jgi:protocatechuate 3,4-dioxygenase beta subunit
MDMTKTQFPPHSGDLPRRKVIAAGGVGLGVAAIGIGGAAVATASSPTETVADESCYLLTAETTEGPYYLDYDLFRKDITEDRTGIPLDLQLKVIDSATCRPVKHAAVDIWHCDALGVYSGYTAVGSGGGGPAPTGPPPSGTPTGTPTGAPPSGGPGGGGGHATPTDDLTYLRGSGLTDRHGVAAFRTVFPGWYRGRCVHIHVKVHIGGTLSDDGYEGGNTAHTGQLFFAEKAVLAAAEVEPYSTSTTTRTTLDEDTIYPGNGAQGGLLHLQYHKGHIAKGVRAHLTLGVDPDADNTVER